MDINTLTREEQTALFFKLEKALGWYSVVTLCTEDVADLIRQSGKDVPDDDALHMACAYVARKADVDTSYLYDWAIEVATD